MHPLLLRSSPRKLVSSSLVASLRAATTAAHDHAAHANANANAMPPRTNDGAASPAEASPPHPIVTCDNYIGGRPVPPSTGSYLPVLDPATQLPVGRVALSASSDVDAAVAAAGLAQPAWAARTARSRCSVLHRFLNLATDHTEELASLIVREGGKNLAEARADVAKGLETVEYAASLPQLLPGAILQVSRGVECRDRRVPLGVVASVVPFNFPLMVPMWTVPIALAAGNAIVVKPSEQVPLTLTRVADLWDRAGLPPGLFGLVQGTGEAARHLLSHPDVSAVTFVGSSDVAERVAAGAGALRRRCVALGGAKNHLIALPDCDPASAAEDIVVSCAGCAGQRCMAASVLILVGDGGGDDAARLDDLLARVVRRAAAIEPGLGPGQMGPVASPAARDRIGTYIAEAEGPDGAEVLLDGRSWAGRGPAWIGPTVLLHRSPTDRAVREEVFGPVLSVLRARTWAEAVAIENSSPYGNAAAVYTTSGGAAEWFVERFRASMLGVNVGIPVPREPFSFGGLYGTRSKYGDMDITGDGAVEFFTQRIKVTSRWPAPLGGEGRGEGDGEDKDKDKDKGEARDAANFAGNM